MNVQDLINRLEDMDPDAEVYVAYQPNYPLQGEVRDDAVVEVDVTEEGFECEACGGTGEAPNPVGPGTVDCEKCDGAGERDRANGETRVYIGVDQCYDEPYAPGYATRALGWRA